MTYSNYTSEKNALITAHEAVKAAHRKLLKALFEARLTALEAAAIPSIVALEEVCVVALKATN